MDQLTPAETGPLVYFGLLVALILVATFGKGEARLRALEVLSTMSGGRLL